jgi:hypothetical protein
MRDFWSVFSEGNEMRIEGWESWGGAIGVRDGPAITDRDEEFGRERSQRSQKEAPDAWAGERS